MNSQRTANSGLTGCLSLGVHRKDFKHVSIYNDGVYQSISWDKNGNTVKVKRVTDGALRALLRNPFWSTG